MARRFSGARLRQVREAAGLRREHLAVRIDRSVPSIADYERDRYVPATPVLCRLADALGCPVDALLVDARDDA